MWYWNRVKEILRLSGISQDSLAKQLQINVRTLHGWIQRGTFPDISTAAQIAKILHVSRMELETEDLADTAQTNAQSRIMELISEKGLAVDDLSAITGIPLYKIKQYAAFYDGPDSIHDYLRIALALDCTLDYLVRWTQDPREIKQASARAQQSPHPGGATATAEQSVQNKEHVQMVKLFQKGTEIRMVPFPIGMTRPASGQEIGAIEIRGDAMANGKISDGDLAFFEIGLLREDGIYVLEADGEFIVQHLQFDHIDKKIIIRSQNSVYQQHKEIAMENDSIRIMGKVISVFHHER